MIMNPLFLYACLFSLCAVMTVLALEKKRIIGGHRITRVALLLLLLIPLLLLLPKWHILPSHRSISPWTDVANQSTPLWLALLWISGAALCLTRIALGAWQLQQWKNQSTPITDAPTLALLHDCCEKQQYPRPIALRTLPQARGPAACGWWHPVIYLPGDWLHWPPATLRAVLLHEVGHHVNRDPLWRLISLLGSSLHWYNPCVHWLSRRLDLQAEIVCDARVIHTGFRKDQYAHILCDLASHAPYAAVAMASPGGLEWRVRQLGSTKFPLTRWWLIVLVVVLFLCAFCLSVLRPARDPGTPIPPSAEDATLRHQAIPFPLD
jgi:hypothetical protein